MANRITWSYPVGTATKFVEISTSASQFGSYVVGTTRNATSDGALKSSSNSWITVYDDANGARTTWYKIRFKSSTAKFSDYSDPVTSLERQQLCTVDDVKNVIDTVGRFDDTEIFNRIVETDEEIYEEAGKPIAAIYSDTVQVDSVIQNIFFVGEENIYRVDRVFYGTTTKTEFYTDDQFVVNPANGMVKIQPVASGGTTLLASKEVEIQYVPMIYHRLSVYRTAKKLLEKLDATSGGSVSKELEVINNRLAMVERLVSDRVGLQLSGDLKYYNPVYGVNRKYLIQDHVRNRWLGSTGYPA